MRLILTFLSAVLMAGTAFAQSGPGPLTALDDAGLKQAFSGTTMDGVYKHPRQKSGTNLFTETFKADGTTDYKEGKIRDIGQWTVKDGIICFSYSGEFMNSQSCFRVFKSGTCLYSYARGRVRDGQPIVPNEWTAKTVIRGELSTCDNLVS